MPEGLGVYIRTLSQGIHGTPRQASRIASEHGVSFVAILTHWQERTKQRLYNQNHIVAYAEAFDSMGIDVHLWGYPWVGYEGLYIDTVRAYSDKLGDTCAGWIVDPELGYKWIGPATSEDDCKSGAIRLMDGLIDAMDEGLDLGVTSYGMARWHWNFPWLTFLQYGWHSPQVYGMATPALRSSYRSWRRYGSKTKMLPSIASYGATDEHQLDNWLEGFDAVEQFPGAVVWSWRQISRLEWRILAKWAERFNR